MKKVIYILILSLISLSLFAQKHDYSWAMGFGAPDTLSSPHKGNKVFVMKFGQAQLKFDTIQDCYYENAQRYIHLGRNGTACYSDINGEFKYATEGFRIYDKNLNLMQNGDSLNFGIKWNAYVQGYPVPYGIMSIPDPANALKYSYVIHSTIVKAGLSHIPRYTKIDLEKNNGLGAVIEKNIDIFENQDSLESPLISQHANGRDWWIFWHKYASNKYFKKLLTPKGFIDMGVQEAGPDEGPSFFYISKSVMSNKGDKYCKYDSPGLYRMADFDRCTGQLANVTLVSIPDSLINYGKLCFSPSGQYVYSTGKSSHNSYVTQIDITTVPPTYKIIFNGLLESSLDCNGLNYLELGPDGQIYVGAVTDSWCMGIIENPDEPYPGCNYKEHINFLPFNSGNDGCIPHFPNYRLGPLKNSGCDTITSINEKSRNADNLISVFPNPAKTSLNIQLLEGYSHSSDIKVSLINASGKLCYSNNILSNSSTLEINTNDLSGGLYCILLRDHHKLIATKKVVVLK